MASPKESSPTNQQTTLLMMNSATKAVQPMSVKTKEEEKKLEKYDHYETVFAFIQTLVNPMGVVMWPFLFIAMDINLPYVFVCPSLFSVCLPFLRPWQKSNQLY